MGATLEGDKCDGEHRAEYDGIGNGEGVLNRAVRPDLIGKETFKQKLEEVKENRRQWKQLEQTTRKENRRQWKQP